MSAHQSYWDSFYAGRKSTAVPLEPSAFARWVAERLAGGTTVAEFGFGNGRDALWFAEQGHVVRGFDFAQAAVEHARARADGADVQAEFTQLDLYDREVALSVVASLTLHQPLAIYGRFLVHSLEDAGRQHLFELAASSLRRGGDLFLEFRTGLDEGRQHEFGDDHFRTYLDPESVGSELRKLGASIDHLETGHGLAVYKSEDPHVARLVASFDGETR